MDKKGHVSLQLPIIEEGREDAAIAGNKVKQILTNICKRHTRRSIRRSWNQLPRCQRNLIIFGISAICITVVFLLPGDQIVSDFNGHEISGAMPFVNRIEGRGGEESRGKAKERPGRWGNINDSTKEQRINVVPLKVPDPQQTQQIVENVGKIPETQRSADLRNSIDLHNNKVLMENKNNINIQEANLSEHKSLQHNSEIDEDQGDRPALEEAVRDPNILPGSKGIAIDDFLQRLETTTNDAERQIFKGPTNERQRAVVKAFKHSWKGYKEYAWGHDNLKPISMGSYDWFGLGLTIIDALDTVYIMALNEEFAEAREWIAESLSFDINRDVNLFEVTIRVLGGLLSVYHLSGDKMFLKKSVELGNRLLPCFLSPSGIPYSDVNLASMSAHSPKWSPDSSTSEVTTIQLEFRDLSRVTNVPMYEKVVDIVNEKVHALEKNNGLVPIFINANTGTFRSYATISLGARGDSYYEYLLKQWIQTGRKENDNFLMDYLESIEGVMSQLVRRTPHDQYVYLGELINGRDFKPKMDHLTCYLPGTLLLGYKNGLPESHLQLANDLLETCYATYMKQPTQLAPEISYFAVNDNEGPDIYVKPNDAHNLLRPEFIESLYYYYALTGNRTYQDMGWTIFQAFDKYTKVTHGYTSIGNVKNIFNTRPRDMMESFWLGETLKYFYLLFSDNRTEIDLNKFIFNTEAHPLPIHVNNVLK